MIKPVEYQCGTCKFAACFDYASTPSGPEDGVHCTSEDYAKIMDKQTGGAAHAVEEFKEYGFLDIWRLEAIAEEEFKCPSWAKK
jgi:hypothetical protein